MNRSFLTIICLCVLSAFAHAKSNSLYSVSRITPSIGDTSVPGKKRSTGTNKDGSPDMRLKKNKEAAKATPTNPSTPVVAPASTKTTPVVSPRPAAPVVNNPTPAKVTPAANTQPTSKTADKVIGTDSKGRTIYEGARGGRYYINKNGNKEYIKKT